MKKVGKFLIAILLTVPMLIGTLFLSPNLTHNATQIAQNGGGGGNSLNSPETGDNSDFDGAEEDPKNDNLKDQIEGEEISSYEQKEFSAYSTDYTIPVSLEEAGTKDNPWQIDCVEDFLFLGSKLLNNKYIELNSDIVLNDEIFDENGDPSGGDGVYYNWKGISLERVTFNGNNHSIVGLFCEDLEGQNKVGLFLDVRDSLIENLNIKNIYLNHANKETNGSYGGYTGGVCRYAYKSTFKNIIIEGTIDGSAVGGIVGYTGATFFSIQNCQTKLNMKGTYVGGIVSIAFGSTTLESSVVDCSVYGKIKGGYVGGVVCDIGPMFFKIDGCKTFATLFSSGCCGGFIGRATLSASKVTVKNSSNYGVVETSGYYSAVIISMMSCSLKVENFSNFGKVKGKTTGSVIGYCLNYESGKTLFIEIKDCYLEIEDNSPIISAFTNNSNNKVLISIKNIKINAKIKSSQNIVFLSNSILADDMQVSNLDINLTSEITQSSIKLFGGEARFVKHKFENIIVRAKTKTLSSLNFVYNISNISNITGAIFEVKSESVEYKYFYGTDFSGLCCDWKTGKLGLKALSGKGFYQGVVTEEVLLNKGFERKVI